MTAGQSSLPRDLPYRGPLCEGPLTGRGVRGCRRYSGDAFQKAGAHEELHGLTSPDMFAGSLVQKASSPQFAKFALSGNSSRGRQIDADCLHSVRDLEFYTSLKPLRAFVHDTCHLSRHHSSKAKTMPHYTLCRSSSFGYIHASRPHEKMGCADVDYNGVTVTMGCVYYMWYISTSLNSEVSGNF